MKKGYFMNKYVNINYLNGKIIIKPGNSWFEVKYKMCILYRKNMRSEYTLLHVLLHVWYNYLLYFYWYERNEIE